MEIIWSGLALQCSRRKRMSARTVESSFHHFFLGMQFCDLTDSSERPGSPVNMFGVRRAPFYRQAVDSSVGRGVGGGVVLSPIIVQRR